MCHAFCIHQSISGHFWLLTYASSVNTSVWTSWSGCGFISCLCLPSKRRPRSESARSCGHPVWSILRNLPFIWAVTSSHSPKQGRGLPSSSSPLPSTVLVVLKVTVLTSERWYFMIVLICHSEWVAISFSRRSSQPRDQTRVFRVAGRCFTVWATREAEFIHEVYTWSINTNKWIKFHYRLLK